MLELLKWKNVSPQLANHIGYEEVGFFLTPFMEKGKSEEVKAGKICVTVKGMFMILEKTLSGSIEI